MTKKKKKQPKISFRLNIFFLLIFLLFSTMILRLGVIQMVYGETYLNEVNRTENITLSNAVPRGKIYDRNGRTVVDNQAVKAITYTRSNTVTQQERLGIAEKLASLIEKETDSVTERDLKDFWILRNPEKVAERVERERAKLTEEELEAFDSKAEYELLIDSITEKDLESIINNPQELEIAAIKRELDTGYAFSRQIVKNDDVTDKEFAVVSANLDQLKGVDATTDWDREYLYDDTLRSVLGSVSETEKGLPREKMDYFLSRGYSRDDRVGTSYIEQQYEDVLQGKKEKIKVVTDKAGNLMNQEVLFEGQRGNDLVLTIDMELQEQVDRILEEEFRASKKKSANFLSDRAFAVMMNPKTGEVLAMSGIKIKYDKNNNYVYEDGKLVLQKYDQGTFTTQYEMGSAVKGATVLAGYQSGVIRPGTVLYDGPIILPGGQKKSSWTNMGNVSDLDALRRSSNVYMFKTAAQMVGWNLGGRIPSLGQEDFDILRNYYRQFGLGVKTGIDLPNEASGQIGYDYRSGKLLDMSIGQFDTYTTLQMAQYVSTIANGGYRLKPQIVREIRKPNDDGSLSGNVIRPFQPIVLNKVGNTDSELKRVQEGFRQAFQSPGGTATSYFRGVSYSPAGKTGTSQTVYFGPQDKYKGRMTNDLALVGYAPFDDPEVAFAIIVPWAKDDAYPTNKVIGRRILDAYFQLKSEGTPDAEKVEIAENENGQ